MLKMPRIIKNILIFSLLGVYFVLVFNFPVYSNTVGELEDQIAQKEQEIKEKESVLQGVERRIKEIGGSNYSISQKIALLTEEINILEKNIKETEEEIENKVKGIEQKQVELEKTKVLIDEVSGDLYIQSRYKVANFFLGVANWNSLVEGLYIRMSTVSMLRFEAEKIGGEFSSLAEGKAELDKQKEGLDKQREGLDEAHKLLANEKARLQAELSKQIAEKSGLATQIGGIRKELSQLQQTLLAVRGGANLSSANIPSSNADPTSQLNYFLSNAPGGTFGVFSFGASTHRNGMSQWGAWERAQQGQTYNDILSYYYSEPHKATLREDGTVATGKYGTETITSTIDVQGYGPISFEDDYMLGIREIDPLFNKDNEKDLNNLKAQAIAARTFALNHTENGRGSICVTQSCQVYSKDRYTGAWEKAVRETRGVTMKNSSGLVFSAQYSSVTGGWINNVGYDVQPGSSPWVERAFEGIAGVSWFHKIWYQMTNANNERYSCSSHPNPWLTGEELADILNAYKYLIDPNSPSSDPRLLSPDHGVCFGGGDPYSSVELRSLVPNGISKVLGAEAINGNGWTTAINFTVKRADGSISTENITGIEKTLAFRDAFNIRAPGFLAIPQKPRYSAGFVHINIVKK